LRCILCNRQATVWVRQVMFRSSAILRACFPGFESRFLQHISWMLAVCACLMTTGIGVNHASASAILKTKRLSSHIEQGSLVWAIAETSASNQETKKSGNQNNPDDVSGRLCIENMDACYDSCKPGEAQPGACNLSCTTDKICGFPVRLSYGQ